MESPSRVAVVAILVLGLGLFPARSAAEGPPPVSFSSEIQANAVNNTVRVGSTNVMNYPRIAIDRHPGSPYYGTIYVVGLLNLTCTLIVVVTSEDGGESFGEPSTTDACLPGPSAEVLVDPDGALYLATWGPTVLRSMDRGQTWENLTTLDTARSPTSLAWDPVTGDLHATWTSTGGERWGFVPGTVVAAVSRDGGRTWTAPRTVLPGGERGDGSQVAAFGGRATVAALADEPEGPQVVAVTSEDAGTSWGAPTPLSRADPCIAAPSIAASGSGLFAISWYEDPGAHDSYSDCLDWGVDVGTFVSLSRDGGSSFSPAALAGGPPGWLPATFGDALVFDNRSRVYVTWHSIEADWSPAHVHVAVSDSDVETFEGSNFAIAMTAAGGNATQQENLAAGVGDTVYLLWKAFAALGGGEEGIFVRRVVGEISGKVELMPGVPRDVPITVELHGPDVARVPWNGTLFVLSNMPPGPYEVSLDWGENTTTAGVARVSAWGVTTFVIRVGEEGGEGGLPGGMPVWLLAISLAGVAGIAAFAYWRRLRARRSG